LAAVLLLLTCLSLAAWLYLIFFRGFFWKADLPPEPDAIELAQWPAVTAVVPARNEAAVIQRTLTSLRHQDYPGRFSIVMIDDSSEDGTAELARRIPDEKGHPLHVIAGAGLSSRKGRNVERPGPGMNTSCLYNPATACGLFNHAGSCRRQAWCRVLEIFPAPVEFGFSHSCHGCCLNRRRMKVNVWDVPDFDRILKRRTKYRARYPENHN